MCVGGDADFTHTVCLTASLNDDSPGELRTARFVCASVVKPLRFGNACSLELFCSSSGSSTPSPSALR